jgi:alkylation response protein AidB-like acyl-CoA dehydrogenase
MNSAVEERERTLAVIAEAVAQLAAPNARLVRATRDSSAGLDAEMWKAMADHGLLAALLPEDDGGTGMGLRAAAVIAEKLGYACRSEPYVGIAVAALRCLSECPASELRDGLVRGIADGSRLITLAWQSPAGDLSLDDTPIWADRQGGVTGLSGTCRFVVAPKADVFLVAARSEGALGLYAVPASAMGLVVHTEKAADGSTMGRLVFDAVDVSRDSVLAHGADAEAALAAAVDAGVLCTAAELLGLIERAVEITLEYLAVRRQFGKPIGSFQVLQHRAVDMWIQKQLTRAALQASLAVFDKPEASTLDRSAAASSAKARASHAATYVAGQAVQLHGAMGMTDEYELGVYVNRCLALAAHLGNAAAHRKRFGDIVSVAEY